MASEYNLKLKAQLDLSDAQAQINRLNTQSNSGVSGGVSPSGNLNSITNSLSSLNRNIDRLNQTVTSLTRNTEKMIHPSGYNSPIFNNNSINIGRLIGGGLIGHSAMQIGNYLTSNNPIQWNETESSRMIREFGNLIMNVLGGAATGAATGSVIPGVGTSVGAGIGVFTGAATSIKQHYNEKAIKSGQYSSDYEKQIDAINKVFENLDKTAEAAGKLEDAKSGALTLDQIKRAIDQSNYNLEMYREKLSDPTMLPQYLESLNGLVTSEIQNLQMYKQLEQVAQIRAEVLKQQQEASENEARIVSQSIQGFNRNTDFGRSVAGVNRMISNNKLDDINKAPESINNLMSIFDTLNTAAQKRREDMENAESVLRQASTPEQYNEALKQYNTSQNELNQIGGLMSSIQTKIADFDKQFSTVEKLPGVKASEISSLAAIGGGGYNITEMGVGGVRSTNIKIERSNELLDTIDKTIRGIDEYLKSTNFNNGATFQ